MNYFIADLHLDHERAMNFPGRIGFSLVEWQKMMLDGINRKVKKLAIDGRPNRLFLLGDFCFTEKSASHFRSKIKCDCAIIIGNHDCGIESLKRVFGRYSVYDTTEVRCCDVPTWLSHYQHLHWPKSHHGSYHLFGHTHMMREEFWNNIPELSERKSLDVCPEHAKILLGEYEPFSEEEVHTILSKRKGHDPVEWYKKSRGELSYRLEKPLASAMGMDRGLFDRPRKRRSEQD